MFKVYEFTYKWRPKNCHFVEYHEGWVKVVVAPSKKKAIKAFKEWDAKSNEEENTESVITDIKTESVIDYLKKSKNRYGLIIVVEEEKNKNEKEKEITKSNSNSNTVNL